jgi:putative transposase
MRDGKNPRHPFFDYRSFAAYFVTICTHERRCLFGAIRRGRMVLNERGKIVVEQWERSEGMRNEVLLDAFVVMPNHLHGIVCIVPPDVADVSPRGYNLDVGPHRHAALVCPA